MIQKKLNTRLMPHEIYANAHPKFNSSVLLESAEKDGQLSRYSFIGFDPERTFTYRKGKASFDGHDVATGYPLAHMRTILQNERVSGAPSGFIFYIF